MRRLPIAVLAAALVIPAASVHAQAVQNIVLRNSFSPIGAGARGLGMGGAFTGVADDGTAASFNPAGLAQLRRSELSLVGFTHRVETNLPNPDTRQTETETSKHQAPDFFGLAVPFEVSGRNLTVQLAYQRSVDLFGRGRAFTRDTVPFRDLKLNIPGSGLVAADVVPEQSGAFRTLSGAAAYALTPRLSIGGSVNYWFADWTAQGSVAVRVSTLATAAQKAVVVATTTRQFRQEQSMHGMSLNGGVLLRYPRISLGATLRMPFVGHYELNETGTVTTSDANGRSSAPTDANAVMTSRLHWPRTTGAGIALRPFTGLTVAADYSHSSWTNTFIEDVPDGVLLTPQEASVNGVDPPATFTNRNFFDLLPASQTSTSDTSEWRSGGEYLLSLPKVVLPLRAGLFRSRSPIREVGGNESRKIDGFTVGSGLNFNRVVLDVAFERRKSEGVVGLQVRRGVTNSTASTVETVKETRIVASLLYRFPDNDAIKRLLRSLFAGGDESGH
jgi:hypothetical protein